MEETGFYGSHILWIIEGDGEDALPVLLPEDDEEDPLPVLLPEGDEEDSKRPFDFRMEVKSFFGSLSFINLFHFL